MNWIYKHHKQYANEQEQKAQKERLAQQVREKLSNNRPRRRR